MHRRRPDEGQADISVRDALKIVERDDVGQCATCTGLAEEGDRYCWYCRTYWNDVSAMYAEEEW